MSVPVYPVPVELPRPQRLEARVSIDMSMGDCQRLMNALTSELHAARGVGRDEGVRVMDAVVQQCTEFIDRMYTEGSFIVMNRKPQFRLNGNKPRSG